MKKFGLKLKKVVGVGLVVSMIIGVGVSDTYAATKNKSWVSRDGKTLYRGTVVSSEANSKQVPLTMWQEKPKGVSITLAVSVGVEQSMSASASFTGEGSIEVATIGVSLGFSTTTSVSYTAEHSYTVGSSNKPGDYRAVLVWPGAELHGTVTAEPNGDGNHQIMNEGNNRLNKKRKVLDQTIKYAPSLTNAKVRLDYRK